MFSGTPLFGYRGNVSEETQLQPCEDSAIEISMPKFKSAVIEQREMQKEVLTGVIIPKLKFIIYKN